MTPTQSKFHEELNADLEKMRSRLKRGTSGYPPKIETAWDILADYRSDLIFSYHILTEIYGKKEVLRLLGK